MKKRTQAERHALRLVKATINGHERAAFVAADELTGARLKSKGYHLNDIIFAEFKKPRNPAFHGLAHVFGTMVVENIEAFQGMDAHSALKRLQIESGIGCHEIAIVLDGMHCMYRVPTSLSFESMDESAFKSVFKGLAEYVASKYWPDLTTDQVEQMAAAMPLAG